MKTDTEPGTREETRKAEAAPAQKGEPAPGTGRDESTGVSVRGGVCPRCGCNIIISGGGVAGGSATLCAFCGHVFGP